jgi:GH15 family glucan-1,4-alpha-glucosidase
MHGFDLASHRLLSDGSGAALLRPDGEVDWWCADRFDSVPTLWSILDPGGAAARFADVTAVARRDEPAEPTTTTTLRAACGAVEVRDGFVHRRLIRVCRCLDGALLLEHEVALGGFDGSPTIGPIRTCLRAPRWHWVALELSTTGVQVVKADAALHVLARAESSARSSGRATVARHHEQRVHDAMSVIRSCTFTSTGATIAAPTTSLPEAIGGDRQFDYRYAWLRDGSLAASVAALSGRLDIAQNHLSFVQYLDARLFDAPVVAVDGRPVPREREVVDVAGWCDSRPIRIGNDARMQLQYDALGFVADALFTYVECGGRLERALWRLLREIADRCSVREESETSGIWEFRKPRPLLSADIGRWIALDRAIRLVRARRPWTRRRRWHRARDECRTAVLAELREDGRLPQSYGGDPDDMDASALLVPIFGMLGKHDRRAHRLVDAHLEALSEGPHLRRYGPGDDGFTGVEGTFVPCSWWAVSALAQLGRLREAETRADMLCMSLPRLLPEQFDPSTETSLGNLPLVWSHAELARAMYMLDLAGKRRRAGAWAAGVVHTMRTVRTRFRSRRGSRSNGA